MAANTANSQTTRPSKLIRTNFYPTLTEEGTNISAWLYTYTFHSVSMGGDGGFPILLTISIAPHSTRRKEGAVKLFIGVA
jgi:hypothetical protein